MIVLILLVRLVRLVLLGLGELELALLGLLVLRGCAVGGRGPGKGPIGHDFLKRHGLVVVIP